MELVYPVCNFLQGITLSMFADLKVIGRENVPPMGPLIVVANHQSNFDPPLLGVTVPRRLRYLAKDGLFRNALASWFLSSYGAFPLNREGADIRAYRWALRQLELDQALVMFPEGTRSPGRMKKAHPGVAQLAVKSQAPILPVGITGTERLGTFLRVFNPTGKITVNIGTVFTLPAIEGKLSKEVLDSLTEMIMHRVAALLPESYHGVYKARARGAVVASDGHVSPSA